MENKRLGLHTCLQSQMDNRHRFWNFDHRFLCIYQANSFGMQPRRRFLCIYQANIFGTLLGLGFLG
tara:strand:+ start:650 stop:847 length:198 start_codon:yes stop_codon:yes gene_type:complete